MLREFLKNTSQGLKEGVPGFYKDHPLAISIREEGRKIIESLLPNHFEDYKVATKKQPSSEEIETLKLAWKICKNVKSNAIVFAKDNKTVGIGAGQMNRVNSVQLATIKASEHYGTTGSVLASDAFFPFRDGIDEAAKAGVKAIVQPGGSIRDDEVIQACDEHGISMIFVGVRHFKH